MIRLLPYHPQVWIDRAATFLTLGYGELAAADAYKAHLLCYAVSIDELKARKPGDGSLTARVFSVILSKLPQAKDETLEAYYLLFFSGIHKIHERAYIILAQGLLCMGAWNDALAVLKEATRAFPENLNLKMLREQWKKRHCQLENDLKVQGKDAETIDTIFKSGQLQRVAYPWITTKELERSSKSMEKLSAKFEAASENACVQKSPLSGASSHNGGGEESHGVFAKCDIQQGEMILLTRSIWTDRKTKTGDAYCSACCWTMPEQTAIQMACCESKFCNERCMQEAKETYHDIICGRDLSWLYEECKEADEVPLMMVKILATAIHQNCKPLKVPCVRTLKANYHNDSLSKFSLFDNIEAPIRALETFGVDVFVNTNFDSWALQTVIARIENNKVGKQTLDNRKYSTIDPLFSMFNHSCTPSAAVHLVGGSTEAMVDAVRDIKKGEEICVSYVEPWVPEMVRREMIRRRIGKLCNCGRCRSEREAIERQNNLRARKAVDAQTFLRSLMAGEGAMGNLRR